MSDERRHFQRLNLVQPLDGWFGDFAVRLLNVSATGAMIESDESLPPHARALLRFYWRGEEVELLAETARVCDGVCGISFVEDSDVLRALIAASAVEMLRAQEANAMGAREANVIADETLTSASGGARASSFVTFILTDTGSWKRRHSLLPDQPPNGFTVGSHEPEDQVALLCRTYESGDDDARRLTRILAEISVAGTH